MRAGKTPVINALTYRKGDLGGDYCLIAFLFQSFAHHFLGTPLHIRIRGIEEIDTAVYRGIDKSDRLSLFHLFPVGHRPQAYRGNFESRPPQVPVFHNFTLSGTITFYMFSYRRVIRFLQKTDEEAAFGEKQLFEMNRL
jgi:hypothetical protein